MSDLPAPVDARLDHLAQELDSMSWNEEIGERQLREFLRDHAYSLGGFANQVRDEYVRTAGNEEDEIPTAAQGVALARFLRPQFRDGVRDAYATVSRGGFDLPTGYIVVRLPDGYTGGIARDGRTST
jgi:hypothetical protein